MDASGAGMPSSCKPSKWNSTASLINCSVSIIVSPTARPKPIMIAGDKNFGEGYLGFGSFDDTGKVDNIRIWGTNAATKTAGSFHRP